MSSSHKTSGCHADNIASILSLNCSSYDLKSYVVLLAGLDLEPVHPGSLNAGLYH